MFKINHILQRPEKIIPWGDKEKSLSWFGLTDGLLWIVAGDGIIYEYKEPHFNEWDEPIIYNDYQLSRFLEDFFDTFPFVAESVPDYIYNDIETFDARMEKWKSLYYDLSDEEFDEFYFDVYYELYDPILARSFDSAHLIGGPDIGCFRNGDRIKFLWKSDYTDEQGNSIWTSPSGIYEMNYSDFIKEVSRFYEAFTVDMDKQVENVRDNGISGVYVDIPGLCRENEMRKEGFEQKLGFLKSGSNSKTDWNKISELYNRMMNEVSNE